MFSRFFLFTLAGLAIAAPALAQQAEAPPATPPVNMTIPKPAPAPETDQANIVILDLSTGGRVTIQLRPDIAPNHVERFKTLVNRGFYNGIVFHRVIDGFMAQSGDPTGTGTGGSDLPDLKSEFGLYPHLRGTVSAARAESPDSANSQFFIMFMPRGSLDRKYTAFGRVIAGMDAVDAIERGEPPANPTKIVKAYMAGGAPIAAPPPAPAPAQETTTPPQ
jgi:peptidylprolyl isomerase